MTITDDYNSVVSTQWTVRVCINATPKNNGLKSNNWLMV